MGTKPAKVAHLQSLGVNSAKVGRFCATKTSPGAHTTPPAHIPGTRAGLHERAPPSSARHAGRARAGAPQGPTRASGLPPREDHASNLVGLVRDITGLLLRVAQAVAGGEAHRAKMGDVHAGHALQGLMDPTVS